MLFRVLHLYLDRSIGGWYCYFQLSGKADFIYNFGLVNFRGQVKELSLWQCMGRQSVLGMRGWYVRNCRLPALLDLRARLPPRLVQLVNLR